MAADTPDQSEQRYVIVGDSHVPVSEVEWALVTMPPNTPIEWLNAVSPLMGFGENLPVNGVGVFVSSMFYDGIVALIDINGKRLSMFPCHYGPNFVVRPLPDMTRLNGANMHGDGV